MSAAQVAGHIRDEVVLLAGGAAQDVPQALGLDKVFIRDRGEDVVDGRASPLLVSGGGSSRLVSQGAVGAGTGEVVSICDFLNQRRGGHTS